MTIRCTTNKGLSFIINVRLRSNTEISTEIQFFSTKTPFLQKQTFRIPYRHQGIIAPFNFNQLEEGIKNLLNIMYTDAPQEDFRYEDMIEAIDILMMHEAPVIDINLGEEFMINSSTTM
ncbi:C1 protein [Sida yellow vein Vietnam virus satellite DNA beta]|uniref:C1 protein n=1 Tax=Sida yellow vein Vietnam betasatellite 1 TaxID=2846224 RepID=A5H1F6_9VIRU|nr:C1 protein [Sida yellow vein Vietnam virus satellite DNA beta]ABG26122.1 C1 protein [Sida yellow vein Vietnam betasatellite 1]